VFWLGGGESQGIWPIPRWTQVVGGLGGPGVLPLATLVLALAIGLVGTWTQARFLVISVAGAGLVMYAARVLLQVWGADPDGGHLSDFPSGHAAATTALAGALLVIVWSATTGRGARVASATGALVAIAAVSTARVIGGFHTPLDIAGGIALAVWWLALATLAAPPDGSRWLSRTQLLVVLLAVGVGGFVLLATLYDREPFSSVDADVARRVAQSMPGWAEAIARPFSWVGGVVGVVAVCLVAAVVLGRERSWLDLGFLLVAVVGSHVLAYAFKEWFDRPRPDAGAAIPLPHSPSFPSGHATTGVVVVGAVAVLLSERVSGRRARTWVWAAAAVLAVGIGLSRIVLNVHYVTDVVGGWCLGLAWLAACLLVSDRLARRQVSRTTALRLPS